MWREKNETQKCRDGCKAEAGLYGSNREENQLAGTQGESNWLTLKTQEQDCSGDLHMSKMKTQNGLMWG